MIGRKGKLERELRFTELALDDLDKRLIEKNRLLTEKTRRARELADELLLAGDVIWDLKDENAALADRIAEYESEETRRHSRYQLLDQSKALVDQIAVLATLQSGNPGRRPNGTFTNESQAKRAQIELERALLAISKEIAK